MTEPVLLITAEEGDDLIVAFAIEGSEPGEIKNLILLRTPKYEIFLDEHERGIDVSRDHRPNADSELLRRIRVAPEAVGLNQEELYTVCTKNPAKVVGLELQ